MTSGEQEKAAEKRFTTEDTESTEMSGPAEGGAPGEDRLETPLAAPGKRAGGNPEMERLVIAEEGGTPPCFAYVGEIKDLRENGLHQGETKELAGARAKAGRRTRGWDDPKWHKSSVPSA